MYIKKRKVGTKRLTGVNEAAAGLGLKTNAGAAALNLEVEALGARAGEVAEGAAAELLGAAAAGAAAGAGDGDLFLLGLNGGISAIPIDASPLSRGGPAGLGRLTLGTGLAAAGAGAAAGAAEAAGAGEPAAGSALVGGLGDATGVLAADAAGVFLPSKLEMSSGTGVGSLNSWLNLSRLASFESCSFLTALLTAACRFC